MTLPVQSLFAEALRTIGNPAPAHISALVPEASTRRYYRLTLSDPSTSLPRGRPEPGRRAGFSTLVGVHEDAATARINMPLVTGIQGMLKKNGVAVPEILYADSEAGIMLQQDLGDLSLNLALRENSDQADALYRQAIRHMIRWQRIPDDGQCPAFRLSFDVPKLMFEFDFFITHTLQGYYGLGSLDGLRDDFTEVAEALAAPQNKVFTHRDYHSRNIMIHRDQQYIIDFQDARLGLFQYDLCSLLYDAYAPIEKTLRGSLIDFAFAEGQSIHGQTRAEFDRYLRLSAFQRLVKAMGTFGRQAALGRKDFEAYLEPAWQMLAEITDGDVKLRGITFRMESAIEKG
ncbi:MAG: phosphotransferase [Turneriella sp.]|nr:phosphotransferase [Turneriella sp.]